MLEDRIAPLFAAADRVPELPHDDDHDRDERGIVASIPTLGGVLGASILGRFGDFDRFANLAGVRSFTGLVPIGCTRHNRACTPTRRSVLGRAPASEEGRAVLALLVDGCQLHRSILTSPH
jgi:transposase